jgi:hypothetical protein
LLPTFEFIDLQIDHHLVRSAHPAEIESATTVQNPQPNDVQVQKDHQRPHWHPISNLAQTSAAFDWICGKEVRQGDASSTHAQGQPGLHLGIAVVPLVPMVNAFVEWQVLEVRL